MESVLLLYEQVIGIISIQVPNIFVLVRLRTKERNQSSSREVAEIVVMT